MNDHLLECWRWSSPVVDSFNIDVGWALHAFVRWTQLCLVGTAHPTIGFFAPFIHLILRICALQYCAQYNIV